LLILHLAIRHLCEDRDERDEDRWLHVLGGSSSLEESSQVLTLVSALPLLLSYPLFLCFFLSMLKRRSSTCRGTPIRLILWISPITFLTRRIVSSSLEDDVDA
jgi:hypothetical protein